MKYLKPLTAITFWGASFVGTKILLTELDPFTILFLRFFIGAAFLGALALIRKKDFTLRKDVHAMILLLAVIAFFHLWIQTTGLIYTSASNTGWIIGTTPVFMVLIGRVFLKEKLSALKISGILISFTGLILLITKGKFSEFNFISNKGDFLILVSSLTWAIYSFINKKIPNSYPSTMAIFYLFVLITLFMAPFAISGTNLNAITHLSVPSWLSILFLGLCCSGIAYVLWSQAMQEMSSAKVGVFLYIEPFVTVITASIVINEQITPLLIISGIIIISGVVLVNWRAKNNQ